MTLYIFLINSSFSLKDKNRSLQMKKMTIFQLKIFMDKIFNVIRIKK